MTTYVYRNGQLVDIRVAGPKHTAAEATHVISDIMPETRHMANSKYYTSKSKFREVTKAHGCTEIGNEVEYCMRPRKRVELDRGQRRDAIRQAIYQLRNGRT